LLKKKVTKNGWLVGVTLFLVSTLAFVQAQKGLEEQLAGVRLEAQFIDYDEQGRLKPDCLLAIYGMPDYIVGGGGTPAQPGLMPSAPAQPGLMPSTLAQPGAVPGVSGMPRVPGMAGMVGIAGMPSMLGQAGAIVPAIPLSELTRIAQMPVFAVREMAKWAAGEAPPPFAPIPQMMGVPAGISTSDVARLAMEGLFPAIPLSELHRLPELLRFQMPGVIGIRPEGTAGAAGVTPTFPRPEELPWVIPPFVQLDTNEFYFVYRRQGAHLNFLMELRRVEDRNELRVVAITVAGRRYDGARTAKGDPFKSIKLGDDLQRVLLRYGQPDEIVYYNPLTLQVVNTPTRNLILRYHRSSNIEFTTLENKVVRIFIFLPRQVNFIR